MRDTPILGGLRWYCNVKLVTEDYYSVPAARPLRRPLCAEVGLARYTLYVDDETQPAREVRRARSG